MFVLVCLCRFLWQIILLTPVTSQLSISQRFLNLQVLILIQYVARPNFRYKCDRRGVCSCQLSGAMGGNPSSEALKPGSLQLVITEVVPSSGKKKKRSCAVQYLNEGLSHYSPTVYHL